MGNKIFLIKFNGETSPLKKYAMEKRGVEKNGDQREKRQILYVVVPPFKNSGSR